MRPRFVWDPRKAQSNVSKHGITFAEAMSVFENPMAKIVPDPEHSLDEHREILVGYPASERLLVVSFTERANATARIISARPATRQERGRYES